jgi:peroxiredoxin
MLVVAVAAAVGCDGASKTQSSGGQTKAATASASPAASGASERAESAPARAAVGSQAPDFTLSDLDGRPVTLSSFRGKTVVLEWFNPGCPFVRKAHTAAKGSLKDLPGRKEKEGVVWLAINSSAAGKQGNEPKMNRDVAAEFKVTYPILRDEDGKIGHVYAATNTPHMFVIDPKGTLVYRGAVDNSPDGEGESPSDPSLVNYVEEAIGAIKDGKTVRVPETKAYGCSVKYAS